MRTRPLYVRVSSADQKAEMQVRELRAYAEHQSWDIAEVYEDVMSGAKANRPALNRLMADDVARKFDCLLVLKLDRFGRSLVHCLNNIRVLEDSGIRFIAVTPEPRHRCEESGIPAAAPRSRRGGRV
jgi:site-specific DNA recombinase